MTVSTIDYSNYMRSMASTKIKPHLRKKEKEPKQFISGLENMIL